MKEDVLNGSVSTGPKFTSIPSDEIERLRDAFQLIDQDSDGNISKQDLRKTYESIGQQISDSEIDKMFSATKSETDISFTSYLSMLSNDLTQIPNKNEIVKAMKIFSEDMEINSKELKDHLKRSGMKEGEVDLVLKNFQTEKMNGDQVFLGKEFLNFITG
jgi:Ca2+-binding EF-hand superfamily protein